MIEFQEELAILGHFIRSCVQEGFNVDHHLFNVLSSGVTPPLVVVGEVTINPLGVGYLEHLGYWFLHRVLSIEEG